MEDVTLKFIKRMGIIAEGDILQTHGLFNGLLCKVASTSATFVFIMNALPDRFGSATDPVSRNRFTKSVITDAFGAVSPGYF
ncbi:uncharacterized protein TNCV_3036231 [Trichonephila clavipes]|nr:uncharacterized protein TNCV_3036231 [Trichonephila clavipes]